MKKLLAIILSIGMLFSFSACGGDKNGEQTDGKAKTESKITRKEYEKMTADDLFNSIVKSPDSVTLDEYVAIVETLQYTNIAASGMELEKNITDEVLEKIKDEYSGNKRPTASEWVPLLITHEAAQVRGKAFGNAYSLYNDPEFVTAAKEVMKTEKEPYVIFFIIQQLPKSIVANDPEIAAFVQEMTHHENARVQSTATRLLETVSNANQ